MSNIHSTAIIDKTAVISESASIGPYCVIGAEVSIGDKCELKSHVVIKGPTNIGNENKFFSFAVIGEDTPDLKFKGEKATLEIGDKNVFREFSKVHRGTGADLGYTKIGNENLIMPGVMIAHDCILGNNNILVDNSALAGHVRLGDYVTLGGYTLVHQFCVLGSYSFTGMGSLISMDVPAFTRVAGNPIKQAGLNSIGLERKSFTKEQIANLKKAYKIFFREGLRAEEALEKISADCEQDENIEMFINSIQSSSRGVIR
tara:strand:+ start:34 stop:810 length:777 start_codon:yes stop_codon:yes gene_type:complete